MTDWLFYAALPLGVLAVALLNVATWRRGDPNAQLHQGISILIPARNEERHIERTLQSIPMSRSGLNIIEILVYDDRSNDSTKQIVQTCMEQDPRIRLLDGVSLPPGWVGKPHALSRLADSAQGDLLFFLDADVELKPGGVSRLASLLSSPAEGRVVSAMPQQVSGTLFEKVVLPLLPLTYLAWLPLRLVELGRDPRTVAANGQLLLLRKTDYRELGGFASVRGQIVDDVAFCRHAKMNGKRVVFADGTLMARCRMYEGAHETVEGFSKNLFEGVGGTVGLIAAVLLYFLTFLLPYFAAALALLLPEFAGSALSPALLGVGANFSLQAVLVLRYRQPALGLLTHPLSILAFSFIALNSWRWQVRGSLRWAGRSYPPMKERTLDVAVQNASHGPAPQLEERAQ